mmetsp:Transcript_10084/g.31092  ORF Transcript_10084/g.31092 Transcript_10084/m.31092 type:complete len:216 (-) Transcript_10084:394-1041(-)
MRLRHLLTQFTRRPRGKMAHARATRQQATTRTLKPRLEDLPSRHTKTPTSMKMLMSARAAFCLSWKLAMAHVAGSSFGLRKALRTIAQKSVAMMPLRSTSSARPKESQDTMQSTFTPMSGDSCMCKTFIASSTAPPTATPASGLPASSQPMLAARPPGVSGVPSGMLLPALKSAMATASLMVDSPKTMMLSNGSTCSALYVESVATGSVAEISEA